MSNAVKGIRVNMKFTGFFFLNFKLAVAISSFSYVVYADEVELTFWHPNFTFKF